MLARAAVIGISLSMSVNAYAAECLQKHARYADEDKAYVLQFVDLGEEQGLSANVFELTTTSGKAKMKGWVIWNNGVSRPNAVVTFNCPDGDITGAELDACRIWEGVVYTVWPDGDVDLLPPGDDPAAPRLLFPDFGRTLKNSNAWVAAKLNHVPWDAFTYTGCSAAK